MVADMRQLMHHHIVNGLLRILHQVQGEADAVLPGAAAEPRPGSGDLHRRGDDAHNGGVVSHLSRQHLLRPLPQSRDLRFRQGRMGRLTGGYLCLGLLQPIGVRGHEPVDLSLCHPQRRANQHAALPRHLQRHRAAAGTDDLICHALTCFL